MKALRVRIGDAEGELVSFDGDRIELRGLSAAFAPGAPIVVEVEGLSLDAKSLGSRRREGGFALTAMLRTLTRHDRRRLKALFSSS